MDTKWLRNSFVYLIILVAIIALFFTVVQQGGAPDVKPIALNTLAQRIKRNEIKSIEVNDDRVVAIASTPGSNDQRFTTRTGRDNFLDAMHNFGVTPDELASVQYTVKEPPQISNWLGILVNLLPLIFFGAILLFMMRQAQGSNNQALSFGKSRARMFMGNKPTITFQDVAGVEEAKQELQEVVEFLKYPEKFAALGARIPKGVLLVGPPGTGKTLLSKAVAGEAGVPFFSISGSEFVEMFVGVGASRVRDLFDQAKKNSPCIVFVDEIDAVGRQRGAGLGGGHDEREQTLNQLLVEMDGFDTNTHVIIIAATNRPDVLDPALLRPGRFDRHVNLDRPDIKGRRQVLDVHSRNKPLDSTVDLEVLARQTPGFSGADLANLINEAAILAARGNKKVIGMGELEEGIERVVAGPEKKSRRLSEHEKEVVAYHEVGHALVAKSLPKCDPVHKVSIISRGQALGVTWYLPTEDRYLTSKAELLDNVAAAMGGRVAEEIVFGDVTSGAENDIQKGTHIARRMVTQWGMSEKLGTVTMGHKEELVFLGRDLGEQRNYSEEEAAVIDEEIKGFVSEAYEKAKRILTEQRSKMDAVVERLKVEETLDAAQLDEILASPQAGSAAQVVS